MKKIFFIGAIGIILFEIFKVYFIMPMPGSQRMNSIDVAYFLHNYRWVFRIVFGLMVIIGSLKAFQGGKVKWVSVGVLALALAVIYMFNFKMVADSMFKQPENLTFKSRSENLLSDSSVVIGVANNGEAKAYPLRYIVYHHQVQDTVGGKPMIITYCSVCRTGRVFDPTVNNHHEKFRLVGMDHFNAMFEDETTKTWWRQVSGEAIAGPLKGQSLPEVESTQVTLGKWFELYPNAVVMQVDEASKDYYDSLGKFERGRSKSDLTRTDSLSWKDKSWVLGVVLNGESKAYDWNQLKEKRVINDVLAGKPIVIALSEDQQSFAVFERLSETEIFSLKQDTLVVGSTAYDFSGRNYAAPAERLKAVRGYQEFWHSWRTFHPNTKQYE